jgi:hypothetical protein
MNRRELPRAELMRTRGGDDSQRLLRLIEELRALDLQRRRQPVASASFRDLVRRMEAKAREVFEEAGSRPDSSIAVEEAPTRRVTH